MISALLRPTVCGSSAAAAVGAVRQRQISSSNNLCSSSYPATAARCFSTILNQWRSPQGGGGGGGGERRPFCWTQNKDSYCNGEIHHSSIGQATTTTTRTATTRNTPTRRSLMTGTGYSSFLCTISSSSNKSISNLLAMPPTLTSLWTLQEHRYPQQQQQYQQVNYQQIRGMSSKRRRKRLARIFQRKVMKEAGIPVKKPPRYIDPKTPVINAVPREEQKRRIQERRKDETLAIPEELKKDTGLPPLIYPFQTSVQETQAALTMSPKVAKVLALSNSTQARVVQAQKAAGMKLFQKQPGDTGSSSVQIIALTARIQQMDTHMIMHPKDKSGKRGLAILRARRRKMLDYLERTDFPAYAKIITTLGLG